MPQDEIGVQDGHGVSFFHCGSGVRLLSEVQVDWREA